MKKSLKFSKLLDKTVENGTKKAVLGALYSKPKELGSLSYTAQRDIRILKNSHKTDIKIIIH